MESLISCLQWALRIRLALECGDSIRAAIGRNHKKSEFDLKLQEWVFCLDQKGDATKILTRVEIYERAFFELIRSGLSGNKIYEHLVEYEKELKEKCLDEIQREIDLMPFKLMIPVLLFQFPAYLLLVMGPIVQQFLETLGGQ